jgi:hypothetical protein
VVIVAGSIRYRSPNGATGAMAAKATMADVMMVRNTGLSCVDGVTLDAIRFSGCDARHDLYGFAWPAMLLRLDRHVELNPPLNQLNRFASVLNQIFR